MTALRHPRLSSSLARASQPLSCASRSFTAARRTPPKTLCGGSVRAAHELCRRWSDTLRGGGASPAAQGLAVYRHRGATVAYGTAMLDLREVGADPERRPSVLVVDDQPTIRTVLTRVLSGHGGFDVAEADDGRAALEWIAQHQAACKAPGVRVATLDLLVLDIMMPKLNGLDVIEALRWTYPTMPRTMVISALDDEEHVAEALRLGAIDYLPKPIDAGMFLHRVETLCSPSAPTHFHWAPLAKLPAIQLGNYPAEVKAISESGIIIQAGPQERPAIGDVVELASAVFDECGIQRQVRGRVVRVTKLRGRRTIELSFVGMRERDLCGIRRFSVRR